MNRVLAEILETRRVQLPDGSSVPLAYHIDANEGAKLQALIRELKPRVTLEVGLGYGISTLYICEALREVGGDQHVVIDPDQTAGFHGIGLFTVERAGYRSLIDFHAAPSHQVLPALERSGCRVGVALIDGWHTFDYALVDFFYIDRILNVGGSVVFDDTRWYPAIRKVVRYVARHRRYAPLSNGTTWPQSWNRRLFNALTPILRLPGVRGVARHVVRPEILTPDSVLGLPPDNFVAFRKLADDRLGDGSDGTRRWDQHFDF